MQVISRWLYLIALSFALSSCATGLSPDETTSFALAKEQRCKALQFGWELNRSILKQIVGGKFSPSGDVDGTGSLLLRLVSCDGQSEVLDQQMFEGAAELLIPVSAENSPVAVTGVDNENWHSLVLVIAPPASPLLSLYKQNGYATMAGEIGLEIKEMGDSFTIEGEIDFNRGHLAVRAQIVGPGELLNVPIVRVGTRQKVVTAAIGTAAAQNFQHGRAFVHLEGETPISDLALPVQAPIVTFENGLVLDLTFLEFPTPAQ